MISRRKAAVTSIWPRKRNWGSGDLAVNLGYREKDTTASFFVGTPFRNNVDTQVNVWTLAPRLRLKPQFGSGTITW
jgi:hypothetical protein